MNPKEIIITCTILLSYILTNDGFGIINTSRPGVSNPTSSVPKGLYQFEMGTNLATGPGMDTTFSIPALIRMGVYNKTEIQVAYASKYLTIGVLYGGISLIDRLENSIILATSMTKNNENLTEYSIYLPISYSLNNGLSIGGHINSSVINDNSDPIISYAFAMGKNIDDKTSWFLELYQSFIKDQKEPPISIDYGFAYLVENNVQFDINMGITFDKYKNKYKESTRFIEWGLSFRLPN